MIHAFTGDSLVSYISLQDPDGTPITGESWEVLIERNPNGDPFGVEVVELSNGVYQMRAQTLASDPPGEYYALVKAVNAPYERRFSEVWDVEKKTVSASAGVFIDSPTGLSLGEIRAMLARQQRDYIKVIATQGSEGKLLYDEFNLVENTDHFRGAEVICKTGHFTNVGVKRKVETSRYETAHVQFTKDYPHPIAEGDVFEFFHFARTGFTIQEYDDAINDAIKNAWPQNREKMYVDPEYLYERDNGIAIPDVLTHVHDIHFFAGGRWYSVPPGRMLGDEGWVVDRARRRIHLGGIYNWNAENSPVRIYGYGRPNVLTNDTDRTSTDIEWIMESASSTLITGMLDQATFPIGQARANRADQLRGKMISIPEPNTVML